ncbi:MAG: TolC family protein [Polyangiaceae bacterium]|nr:TolC family protein [Polyangiaceae bacterium]
MVRPLWPFLLSAAMVCVGHTANGEVPALPGTGVGSSASAGVLPTAQPRARVPLYDLTACLKLAAANYPKVNEARARLRQKQSQLSQAEAAPYSNFSSTAGVGLAPTTRGTNIYSPDSDASLSSDLGLGWQVGIEGGVPLWTFGKISGLIEAAQAQVQVGQHEISKERNSALLQVRTAYYGVQLARDSIALVDEAKRRIDKYLPRLEQSVEEGDGDDIDLLKMKMYRADLDTRYAEARREEFKALSGLRFLTGATGLFDIPDDPLSRLPHRLAPLSRYLDAARLFRPEINMARAGKVARAAQWNLERARSYPDVALGLSAKWARAPQVTDQRNPFVSDDANTFRYGFALGMKWNLDFLSQYARIDEAKAKVEEMEATEKFAAGGVAVEVEQAFRDAEAADTRLRSVLIALDYSKQWLVKVQQGIDVGTMDEQDIVDPAKEYALRRFGYISAIFDYNTALSRLAQATGWVAVLDEN